MTGVLEELDSLYCSECEGPRYWQDAGNKRIANVLSIGDTEVPPVTLFTACLCTFILVQSLKSHLSHAWAVSDQVTDSKVWREITLFLLTTEVRKGPNCSTIPSKTDDRPEHWCMRST
jgi:hypothetical protein